MLVTSACYANLNKSFKPQSSEPILAGWSCQRQFLELPLTMNLKLILTDWQPEDMETHIFACKNTNIQHPSPQGQLDCHWISTRFCFFFSHIGSVVSMFGRECVELSNTRRITQVILSKAALSLEKDVQSHLFSYCCYLFPLSIKKSLVDEAYTKLYFACSS